MGQVSFKPQPHQLASDFANLPKEAIMNIWLTYNLLGEGWSLTFDQFASIFKEATFVQSIYNFSDVQLRGFFDHFDTDQNGLIDALETIVALGLLSGMDAIDKIYFAFSAFDFDSKASLSNDEANLLFRSVTKGLSKASPKTGVFAKAGEKEAEIFAGLLFDAMTKSKSSERISVDEFKAYCVTHPVVSNWIKSICVLETEDSRSSTLSLREEERKEWLAVLSAPFVVAAKQSRLRSIPTEITQANDEVQQDIENDIKLAALLAEEKKAKDTGDEEEGAKPKKAPAVDLPIMKIPWVAKVDKLKPEEVPGNPRTDTPEDVIEPLWIGGLNYRRSASLNCSFLSSRIHRTGRYTSAACDSLVYSAGNSFIVIKKNEETSQWSQNIYTAHENPISCFDINTLKGIMVSADRSVGSDNTTTYLNIWNTSNFSVSKRIAMSKNIKYIDINANGTLVVVLLEDIGNTLSVIDVTSGATVFTKKLMLESLTDVVNDVRFFGTSAMIAIACERQGVRFLVDEESGIMGGNNMHLYEERPALYGIVGKDMKGVSVTELCRLENSDEMASGLSNGKILFWKGRTIAQVIDANRGSITALDFDATSRSLISGCDAGTIAIFDLVDSGLTSAGKGPKPAVTRSLQNSANFDILRHNLQSFVIGTLSFSNGGSKAILTTSGNEVMEIACKLRVPTAEELEAEAANAAEGGEGAVPATKGQLGDDLHNGVLVTGHYVSEDFGVTTSSMCKFGTNGFISCGSDSTVRVWQAASEGDGPVFYKVAKSIKMDCPCSAVAASSTSVAVALSGKDSARTGSIHIFGLPDANFISELTDNKSTVLDMKISPEGNLIVASSSDGQVYVYTQVEGNWSLKGRLTGSNGPMAPSCMDLSADNQYLRCYYSSINEIRVFDLSAQFGVDVFHLLMNALKDAKPVEVNEDGEPQAGPVPGAQYLDILKAISWAGNSCPFNWDTEGSPLLHLDTPQGFTRYYERSNLIMLCTQPSGSLSISRVPAFDPSKLGSRAIPMHTGGISGLLVTDEGGSKLVTSGAVDGIIRVWKINYDNDELEPDLPDPPKEEEKPADDGEEGKPKLAEIEDSGDEEDYLDVHKMKYHLRRPALVVGDEVSAIPSTVRHWTSSLGYSRPSDLSDVVNKAFGVEKATLPVDDLALDWVYGCTARSTRNSVRYTADGSIVYPAGPMTIIFNKVTKTQIRVQPHRDEITALDIHNSKNIGISAHKGAGNIYAFIFRVTDGAIIRTLDIGVVNGVSAVKFSPDGTVVAIASQDQHHTVFIYSVSDGSLLSRASSGREKALNLTFSDLPVANGTTLRILQGAVKSFKLLSYVTTTRTIHTKVGGYGADVRKASVNCAAALPLVVGEDGTASGNEFILGMSDGTIGILSRGESKVSSFAPCLTGPVTALCVVRVKAPTAEDPNPVYKTIIAGVKGAMKILGMDGEPLLELNLYLKDYGLYSLGRVRGFKSVNVDKTNRKILYATSAGEIGEIDINNGSDLNENKPIVTAHFRDQLNALCSHPIRQECLTAGEDKTLRVWDLATHSLAAIIELPGKAIAGTFAPNGLLLCVSVGQKETESIGGRMVVVSYLQGKIRIVHVANDARLDITSLVFSPDGSKVYAGSLDSNIYVYDALNNFALVGTLSGAAEGIVSLDIAKNGKYMVSEGVRFENLLWDLASNSIVARPSDKVEIMSEIASLWCVRQNVFGLSSLGVVPANGTRHQVTSLAQSRNGKLLATGEDSGALKLFNNPAADICAPHKNYCVHSLGGVSKVAFTADDEYLLSTGRADKLLLQWRVLHSTAFPDPEPAAPTADSSTGLPVFSPDESYDNSFVVKGIDFRDASSEVNTFAPSQTILSQISNITGFGNNSSVSNLPVALYCGHGEVVSAFGKVVASMEDNGSKLRLWNCSAISNSSNPVEGRGEVSCLSVSSSGRFVMVGYLPHSSEAEGAPLHLYSAPIGELVSDLHPSITGGVARGAFSRDGQLAACLGRDAMHSLYVFKTFSGLWDDAVLLYTGHVSAANMDVFSFLPWSSSERAGYDLAIAGAGRIQFWRAEGLNFTRDLGVYGEDESTAEPGPQFTAITAVAGGVGASCRDEAITGDADGNVYIWTGRYRSLLVENLGSPVTALVSFGLGDRSRSNRSGFAVASQQLINVWSTNFRVEILHSISLASSLSRDALAWAGDLYGHLASETIVRGMACDPNCRQILLSLSTGLALQLSTDSGTVSRVLDGHSSHHQITSLVEVPGHRGLLLTSSTDCNLRLWNTGAERVIAGVSLLDSKSERDGSLPSSATLVGGVKLENAVTAAMFLGEFLLAAVDKVDASGNSSSILVLRLSREANPTPGQSEFSFEVVHRIHNVGKGTIRSFQQSSNGMLAACCSDGNAYIYSIIRGESGDESGPNCVAGLGLITALGGLLAHTSGEAVTTVDFSSDGKIVRSFGENFAKQNGKVEVNFFSFAALEGENAVQAKKNQAAPKVQDVGVIESFKALSWQSASSPAAPELRGLSISEETVVHVESVAVSSDKKLVAASYSDGAVRVFRYPVTSQLSLQSPRSHVSLVAHAAGSALLSFSSAPTKDGLYELFSVSKADGCLVSWVLQT